MNVAGPAVSGRYVIVQMDNGEGVHLNLREVRAFGPKGDTQKRTEHYLDWIYYRVWCLHRSKNCILAHTFPY